MIKNELGQVVQLLKIMKGLKKSHESFLKGVGSKYQITAAQMDILWIVAHRSGITVTELSELGLLHISTAMHLIAVLEQKNLVQKKNSVHDKRTWHVHITENGKQIVQNVISSHDPRTNKLLQATRKVAHEMNVDVEQFIDFGLRLVKELNGDDYYTWVNQNAKEISENSNS